MIRKSGLFGGQYRADTESQYFSTRKRQNVVTLKAKWIMPTGLYNYLDYEFVMEILTMFESVKREAIVVDVSLFFLFF